MKYTIGQSFIYNGLLYTICEICKPCKKIWVKDDNTYYLFKLDKYDNLHLIKKI
jgi:hypothetical protein